MIGYLLMLVFFLGGCGLVQNSSTERDLKTITVCELFKKLEAYRGRIVAVRGVYRDGLRQDDCREKLVTGGHEWPTALFLVDSSFSRDDEEAVPFATDHGSWDALERLDRRVSGQRPRPDIWVTVVGQLRTRKEYVLKNGDVVAGYGHLGVCPAELVVRKVTDIVMVPKLR